MVKEDRRRFLEKAWIGIGVAACLEAIWIVIDFLRPKKVAASEEAAVIIAGHVGRFERASVTAFPAGRFYLVCLEDGGFLALARECTHLGCTLPWVDEENRFVCPCHSSAFDMRGEVISPPAPRPLDFYTIRIENHIVKVDTRLAYKRGSFHSSQVTHP